MTGWLVFGILMALFLCYAADRVVQARVRARRLRRMTERLAAASVLPAIKRPPLTLPGPASRGDVPPEG